jgi:thiol-disulfide isomerase/thioredoxin
MSRNDDRHPLRIWLGRLWIPIALAVLIVYVFRTVNPELELDGPAHDAPVFERPALDARPFNLAEHRGRPVVINFWATWCEPCRVEVPGFVDLQEEFGDDVVFVGVSMDDGGFDTIRPFARQFAVNYPMVMDRNRLFAEYGGGGTIPTTYVVDANGQVRAVHRGIITKRSLRPALQQLVEEASTDARL